MEKHISETYTSPKLENPKLIRDRRAKELRALGYMVVCKKWSFAGFGYGDSYTLEATLKDEVSNER
jgi:hypothetical protein